MTEDSGLRPVTRARQLWGMMRVRAFLLLIVLAIRCDTSIAQEPNAGAGNKDDEVRKLIDQLVFEHERATLAGWEEA